MHVTAGPPERRKEGGKQKKHNHTETPGSEPRQAAMHPSDSFYAHYVHPRPERIDSHVHPALRRSRGLVALVRLGGSSSIARGGNGRPCVLNVLANLCDDVRANCDIPAILQALGALGCASSLEYLFETLRDHPHPVTLVFERSGTGILLHAAEAGGGECSACSNPATDSPVPLVLTIKLNGPMLAERTTLSMLPTITWEQGTSCRQSTVPSMPGNCSARRSRSASFVRQRLNCSAGAAISDAVGGPFMLGYAHAVLSFSHPCTDA